jgi:hypothetical protein
MANELHEAAVTAGDLPVTDADAAAASPPVPCTPDTEEWINEGGSTAPPAAGPKAAHDTESGCRERAAADVTLAREADTENGRIRLERSSASWTARADDIHKLDEDAEGQKAADRALWESEESDFDAEAPDL